MVRKIIITKDGSPSVSVPEMGVTYHSIHGALQESMHVYIDAGLHYTSRRREQPETLQILEIGFGTGLNALLTLIETEKNQQKIHYTAIELYPLTMEEVLSLNYCELLGRQDLIPFFQQLHACHWEKETDITGNFVLIKVNTSLVGFLTNSQLNSQPFNLIYYDAFAPAAQPELWAPEIFQKLFQWMAPGGILVTYCSKGAVRRAMQAAGFIVEKIPGPPGKREMIRAVRPVNKS